MHVCHLATELGRVSRIDMVMVILNVLLTYVLERLWPMKEHISVLDSRTKRQGCLDHCEIQDLLYQV